MKKSQRLRLANLKSKDAATLSEAEKNDLKQLEALAVLNPDASKDEDDTKAKPLSAQDFLAKLSAAQAQLVVVAAFLGLTTEALAAKKPEEITAALSAKVQAPATTDATLTAKITALETGLTAAKITITAADAAKGITATDVTTAIVARSNVLAGEKLAELGFPAGGLPTASKENAGAAAGDLLARYASISSPSEAAEFYATNIAPLIEPKRN